MTEAQKEFIDYIERVIRNSPLDYNEAFHKALEEAAVREVGKSYGLSEFEISQCGMYTKATQ